MIQLKAKIIKNIEVAPDYHKMVLSCPDIAKRAKPGQFIEVKTSDDFEPLLRRPLSIHGLSASNIEILFEVVGQGTQILSSKDAGEYLDVIGPLGNGFNLTPHSVRRTPILVAGGMGVAPLVFLSEELKELKMQVLIGAKAKKGILCEKEFKNLGCKVKVATDDGSKGLKGRVTDLLKGILNQGQRGYREDGDDLCIYACGPEPMLKEIAVLSKKHNIPAQVSLEAHMACGIGACLGCVVDTIDGYKRVCKEGPVFDAREIIW